MPPSDGFIVTRFAPSPTGHLHIGGARTALFCWAFAKTQKDAAGRPGRFMIRIEDTDQARSSDESARGILEDLAWLGIEWDDGPTLTLPDGRVIGKDARKIEGGYFQAKRRDIYNREIERLVRAGRAYPAFEGAEDLEAKRRAAVAAKRTYRYERPADVAPGVFNEPRWKRAQAGETHVVRFLAPHEEIVVHDQVLGDVKNAPGELDDIVIRKTDGFPTYHFAVVVDDELMGVTHVLRAQEHLANTPRHVAMQRALGYRTPVYGHMPLIFNMDATKMGKRDKAKVARAGLQQRMQQDKALSAAAVAERSGVDEKTVAAFLAKETDAVEVAEKVARFLGLPLPEIEVSDFREAGYVPEAIINFLGLLGWNPGMKLPDGKDLEKFDVRFLAQHFSLDRIGKTNAKFDRKKLLSFNGDYLAAMSDEQFADRWEHWLLREREVSLRGKPEVIAACLRDPTRRAWLARAVKLRAKTFVDAVNACEFLLRSDDGAAFDHKAVEKTLLAENKAGLALLRELRGELSALVAWDPTSLHLTLEGFAQAKGFLTEKGVNIGPVAQPVRVAISGAAVTPPLGETMAVLGRGSVLARIDRCLAYCAAR